MLQISGVPGSRRVLREMRRPYSPEYYVNLAHSIREKLFDASIGADVMIGFPGETDEEFEETLKLVDEVRYAAAFSFKFSARPGTPAATMENQVAPEVMDERLQRLQAALDRHRLSFNQASVGKRCEVLVERRGKLPAQWLGKSPWLQSVHFSGPEAKDTAIGDIVRVMLAEAGPNSLSGRLLQSAHA